MKNEESSSAANDGSSPLGLSPEDARQIESLRRKLQLLEDRVVGVVAGLHPGFHVWGRGGIGKSYAIISKLEQLRVDYRLWNSRLTGRALFDHLFEAPDAIHLLEDVEVVVADNHGKGVLRSALWSNHMGRDGRMERRITWNVCGKIEECVFRGGLIITSNRDIADLPELKALKTRIDSQHLVVTNSEAAALMRHVAMQGYERGDYALSPEVCLEVAEYVIEESRRQGRDINMRLLTSSLADRLLVEDEEAGCSWQDLVSSRIRGQPDVVNEIVPQGVRACKRHHELEIVRQMVGLPPAEQLRVWIAETGKSKSAMYRRYKALAMADARGLDV